MLTWGNLQAYGNYVYFEIISMLPKEGDSQKEENNGYDYDRLYNKTFVYDIQADKIEELQIPDMPKSVHILGYNSGRIRSFWIPMMMKKEVMNRCRYILLIWMDPI